MEVMDQAGDSAPPPMPDPKLTAFCPAPPLRIMLDSAIMRRRPVEVREEDAEVGGDLVCRVGEVMDMSISVYAIALSSMLKLLVLTISWSWVSL